MYLHRLTVIFISVDVKLHVLVQFHYNFCRDALPFSQDWVLKCAITFIPREKLPKLAGLDAILVGLPICSHALHLKCQTTAIITNKSQLSEIILVSFAINSSVLGLPLHIRVTKYIVGFLQKCYTIFFFLGMARHNLQ